MLFGVLTGSGAARAHPDSAEVWGNQIDVRIAREEVLVEVTVEVPVRDAATLAAQWVKAHPDAPREDFDRAFKAGILQDLRVELNGEVLSARPAEPAPVTQEDPRFVVWRVRAEAAWPNGIGAMSVVHGAWPGEEAVYNAAVWVDDDVALERSSLLARRGGRLVSTDGQWRADPGLRELDLFVRRRAAPEAWRHRAWRRLTTPAADWAESAPEAEVLAGTEVGLTRLLGGAPDAPWRGFVAGALLGLGAALHPARSLALLGLRGHRIRLMTGIAVGLVAGLQLLPVSAVPDAVWPLLGAAACGWAASNAARDRPVGVPVGVVLGLVVLAPLVDGVAVGLARGTAHVAGLGIAGAAMSVGLVAWLGGRVLAGRLPPRARAVALVAAASLQLVLAAGG